MRVFNQKRVFVNSFINSVEICGQTNIKLPLYDELSNQASLIFEPSSSISMRPQNKHYMNSSYDHVFPMQLRLLVIKSKVIWGLFALSFNSVRKRPMTRPRFDDILRYHTLSLLSSINNDMCITIFAEFKEERRILLEVIGPELQSLYDDRQIEVRIFHELQDDDNSIIPFFLSLLLSEWSRPGGICRHVLWHWSKRHRWRVWSVLAGRPLTGSGGMPQVQQEHIFHCK